MIAIWEIGVGTSEPVIAVGLAEMRAEQERFAKQMAELRKI
jgi:hypothetical protein